MEELKNKELKEEEDWKLRLQRMRDEVKKVQELPKVNFFFHGFWLCNSLKNRVKKLSINI